MVSNNKNAKVVGLRAPALKNAELVDGLRLGDPVVATQFHHRFGKQVSRWVWRLLGADKEHDDLVQQVFVNILSSIKTLKNPDTLSDWVNSVTFRTVRKELRRRKYRRLLTLSTLHVERALDETNPDRRVCIRRFYVVLDQMRPDDRMIFVLRYLEGYSLGEVASIGGYSLSTAKRRLNRAKRDFKTRAVEDPVLSTVLEVNSNAD